MQDASNRSAGLLRAYAQNLKSRGLTEAVAAHLPPTSRQLFLEPPLAASWMDGQVIFDVYEAVAKVGGKAAVRQLTYESTRDSLGPTLKPMIDVTLAIHGRSPATFFTHFDRVARTFLRETRVTYVAEGPQSGFLEVHYEHPTAAMSFPGWEGVFSAMVELIGARGTIGPCEANPALTYGRMHLAWT